jgi:chromosome partitioning protein
MMPAMGGIIASAGQKGGSGKTTVAVALGSELHARGERVLLVDADPQQTILTWGAALTEAGRSAPAIEAMGADMLSKGRLDKAIAKHDPSYVLIDCPPGLGEVQRAALMLADVTVLPCGQSYFDGWSLARSFDLIKGAMRYRPDLIVRVLITRWQARTLLGKNAEDAIAEGEKEHDIKVPILRTKLGYRVSYQEFPGTGLSPSEYAPDPIATEINDLIAELRKELHRAQAQDPATRTTSAPARRR